MSRKSAEKAIEKYVYELMPGEVQEARERALHNLYYGAAEPDEDIGTTWAENSKVVERWWDDNMRGDLIVDDGDDVSTKHEFDKFLESIGKERYDEALSEYLAEHADEADDEDIDLDADAVAFAAREAQNYIDGSNENAMLFDSRDVKNLILGSEWPL